jgi:hypothetical protein
MTGWAGMATCQGFEQEVCSKGQDQQSGDEGAAYSCINGQERGPHKMFEEFHRLSNLFNVGGKTSVENGFCTSNVNVLKLYILNVHHSNNKPARKHKLENCRPWLT